MLALAAFGGNYVVHNCLLFQWMPLVVTTGVACHHITTELTAVRTVGLKSEKNFFLSKFNFLKKVDA